MTINYLRVSMCFYMHLWYFFFIFVDTAVDELKFCRVLLLTAVDTNVDDSTRR